MSSQRTYRPDIDGLRAIAILLVIGNHIGLPGMAGGFVGVDVFFVISGYLITGLLLQERSTTGRIDIAAFYARRVRRLLPALGVVIAATLLVGTVLLLPDEQIALGKSAIAASGFVANIYFWAIGRSYFAETSELAPLQHLWTLAVEEQFYLVWPLVLMLVASMAARARFDGRRATVAALAAGGLISLALSIVLTARFPVGAFFLPPTRAWEFAVGGLLAAAPAIPTRLARPLGILGLAAIAAATLLFDELTPFPSYHALLPVGGAAALLAAGAVAPQSLVGRVLSSRPFVAIGLVSYGWYLWHWPLLAFGRSLWGTEAALPRDSGFALLALVLAAASWRWIETPVRRGRIRGFATTPQALASGTAILLTCAMLAGALWAWGERPLPPGSVLAQYHAARGGAARDFPFCEAPPWGAWCQAGAPDGKTAILLWGDSHAAHLARGLDPAARAAGVKVIVRTMGACNPGVAGPGPRARRDDGFLAACARFNARVLDSIPALRRDQNLTGVIIAGNWVTAYTGWKQTLDPRVAALTRSGLRVALMQDTPRLQKSFVVCVLRRGVDDCALPRADVERRSAPADRALAAVAAKAPSQVRRWSLLDPLCPDDRCPTLLDGRLVYRNATHLTLDGSALLAPSMTPVIAWLVGGSRDAEPAREHPSRAAAVDAGDPVLQPLVDPE